MRNSGTLFANDLRKDRCKAHVLKLELVMFEGFFVHKNRRFLEYGWSIGYRGGKFGKCGVWKVMLIFGWKSMNNFENLKCWLMSIL